MGGPLPQSLQAECRHASKIFSSFVDPAKGLDTIVPPHILQRAKGFAILSVAKAGFIVSARAGSGLVIARLADGGWSAPSAIGTAGGGFGFQAGVEMAEFLIILNSRAAVASFMASGSLTLGGNLSIAAGPIGRNLEGTGSVSTKGKVSAMYSYSKTKGLFGGASIEGSVIVERQDANRQAYGYNVTAKQLLSGSVDPPPFADILIDTISRRSGRSNDSSAWQEQPDSDDEADADESMRPDPSRGYAFGTSGFASASSANSPNDAASVSSSGKERTRERPRDDYERGTKTRLSMPSLPGRGRSHSEKKADERAREQREKAREDPFGFGSGALYVNRDKANFEQQFDSVGVEDDTKERVGWNAGGAQTGKAGSAKLVKSRSGQGQQGRDWDRDRGGDFAAESTFADPRDSFESLDDERSRYTRYDQDREDEDYSPVTSSKGRFRSSTITASNSSTSRPSMLQRARSASSPFSFSKSSSKPGSARNSRPSTPRAGYTEDLEDPFNAPRYTSSSTSRSRSGSQTKTTTTKPWDSEDESFFSSPPPVAINSATPSRAVPISAEKDPFDLQDLGAEVARARGRPEMMRGRSSTGGGGIGRAIALYDFAGVEPTDLPFKKNDIITILARDDEEWWRGRIKLREGNFPRNYVEAHLD